MHSWAQSGLGFWVWGFRGLGFQGLGFRGLGFRVGECHRNISNNSTVAIVRIVSIVMISNNIVIENSNES